MSNNQILIDVMVCGRFFCQLRYKGTPFPEIINGKVVPVYNADDIKKFIEKERPSLIGKKYNIQFASQQVFNR